MYDRQQRLCLVARVGARLCALPLAHVRETMRLLPVEPLAGAPVFVLGIAVIRGEVVPVVDGAWLVGVEGSLPSRLVTVEADGRTVALALDDVLGVRDLAVVTPSELPPLIREVEAAALVSLGSLDVELVAVLEAVHMVPEPVWELVADAAGARQ